MSKLTESLAKEHLEKIKEIEEKNKKIREEYEKKWGPYDKLMKKLLEILNELFDYKCLRKLTKEESSKYIELGNCYEYFKSNRPTNEQQFSEIMEKLHAVVQEAWDFLGKIRLKYGDIQEKKIIRTSWILVISISIILAVLILFCRLLK